MDLENLIPTGIISATTTFASSDDLTKICRFCDYCKYMEYSSDSGLTWTLSIINAECISSTSNSDGSQFFAIFYKTETDKNIICKSTDGITWIECIIDPTNFPNKIISNGLGDIVYYSALNKLYKYNKTINTFELIKTFDNNIRKFCCSDDGLKIYITNFLNNEFNITYTLDGGLTWNSTILIISMDDNYQLFCNKDASAIYVSCANVRLLGPTIYNIGDFSNIITNNTPLSFFLSIKADRDCKTIIINNKSIFYKSVDQCITWTNDVCTTPKRWCDFIFTPDVSNLICAGDYDYIYLRGNPNPPTPPIPPTPVIYDFVGKYKGTGIETTVYECGKKKVIQVKHCLKIKKNNDTSYLATFKDCHKKVFNINCFLKDNKLYSGNNGYDVFYVVDNVLMLSYTPPMNEDGSVSTTTFIYSKL